MHRVRSSGGVTLAVHDLGGQGPPLLLVHPTGFCAGAMAPLARRLADRFHCWAVDLRGHGRSTPPAPGVGWGWDGLADDVAAAAAEVVAQSGPVAGKLFGLGHSSGGAALLGAAAGFPALGAMWCYEPIVWPEPALAAERAARLAAGARRRRATFPSAADALANFEAKPPFSAFHPECRAAYVDGGFALGSDGSVSLRCDPQWEAAIYEAGVEGDRFAALTGVTVPVAVAFGARTDPIGVDSAAKVAGALPAGELLACTELSHFGPFEAPDAVAAAAGTWLEAHA